MYIDGFVYAVPKANKQALIAFAQKSAELFVKHGALRVVESWGDHFDEEEGAATFAAGVKCKDDEQVMFSWCEWPDRATRDAAYENMMEDIEKLGLMEMPFDGKRMIYGSFKPIVETPVIPSSQFSGTTNYVDGYLYAIQKRRKDEFIKFAEEMAALFKRSGALRVMECWEDDVPEGKVTSMPLAVSRKEDEAVLFSWVEWETKEKRDAVCATIHVEAEKVPFDKSLFDMKRMAMGGFEVVVDV